MSNRLLISSDYNYKSGYDSVLITLLEKCISKGVVVLPKYYNKPLEKYNKYFNSGLKRDGTEKELLVYPSFNYLDLSHPISHVINAKNKSYFTMWEASVIGDFFIDKINTLNQIIVPNAWNKQTFENQGCDRKISVVNLGVDTDIFNYSNPDNNDCFVFGTGNNDPRKRLSEVIKCFVKAFPKEKDVRLCVKISEHFSQKFSDNRIIFDASNLSREQLKNWYCSNDVFVSGVSAEGWGLMQHESMACGRPVIAANYGGLKEFMTAENSFCLDYDEVDATGFWEFPGAKWSKFKEEHMIETMRYCYHNRKIVYEKGKLASVDACKLSSDKFVENLLTVLSVDF